jgi:hypothetical protein
MARSSLVHESPSISCWRLRQARRCAGMNATGAYFIPFPLGMPNIRRRSAGPREIGTIPRAILASGPRPRQFLALGRFRVSGYCGRSALPLSVTPLLHRSESVAAKPAVATSARGATETSAAEAVGDSGGRHRRGAKQGRSRDGNPSCLPLLNDSPSDYRHARVSSRSR